MLFARSATAGGQQFPVHWGGDCESTFVSMAETLRGGLSLASSGFGFWSHDIGGFEGTPDAAVFKRWLAFGLLSSHSRLHGSDSYRVPWAFDEEAVDVARAVHAAQALAHAVPRAAAARTPTTHGRPGDAADGAGVPRRPGRRDRRHASTCSARTCSSRRCSPPTATSTSTCPEGTWTSLLDGRPGDRTALGPRAARLRLSLPLLRPARTRCCPSARATDRPDYDVGRRRHAAPVRARRRAPLGDHGPVAGRWRADDVRRDARRCRRSASRRAAPTAPWRVAVAGGASVAADAGPDGRARRSERWSPARSARAVAGALPRCVS